MSARTSRESEFEFTLTLDGIADLTEDIENALFAAGCDDATISAESGHVVATFCRSAPTMTRRSCRPSRMCGARASAPRASESMAAAAQGRNAFVIRNAGTCRPRQSVYTGRRAPVSFALRSIVLFHPAEQLPPVVVVELGRQDVGRYFGRLRSII